MRMVRRPLGCSLRRELGKRPVVEALGGVSSFYESWRGSPQTRGRRLTVEVAVNRENW